MMLLSAVIMGGVLALAVSDVDAAELYRWKESGGAVVYADILPPDKVRDGHAVLNSQGREVRQLPPELSPEEREALRREEAQREALRREAQKQAERDAMLLKLYASETSILEARDARLAAQDAQCKVLERQLDDQRARLAMLEEREPGHAELPELKRRIEEGEQAIERLQQERQRTVEAFAQDLARWRALKRVSSSAPRSQLSP
ncbi:MAG: DUF4124 domain-containing protein [Gammaproteobacteria bacterium]|nr:DUF4124 domain-containing protein [Gammaproteobacteria bacterium]